MAKARKKKKAMTKKLVKTLAWSWQKLLTLLSIPKTPPQLYPSLEEIIDCTCARPILIPPPTLHHNLTNKQKSWNNFPSTSWGVIFLQSSLSFPQTFVPSWAQEVLKKTYSIVLNFPRFFPEKPKFFALKWRLWKKKKIEWKKMNKKQHDSTLEKTKLQICISVF